MKTHANHLIQALQQQRKRLGMSYQVLADRSGLGIATVQRVLNGDTGVRLDSVMAMAEVLGVKVKCECRDAMELRRQQARSKACRLTAFTQGTSALEAQGIDQKTLKETEEMIYHKLMASNNTRLWAD